MAQKIGRLLLIKKGGTAIASIRTKTVSINNEPVDITTDDDDGFRRLLDIVGQQSIDLSIEGLSTDTVFRAFILTPGTILLTDITIEYPGGGTIDGDFALTTFEEAGTYNDAITFSGTLQSSGVYTYTP